MGSSLIVQVVKKKKKKKKNKKTNHLQCRRPGFNSSVRKSLVKRMATTPVILPGEAHRHRSLAGYSPLGRKELDMTEQLTQEKP